MNEQHAANNKKRRKRKKRRRRRRRKSERKKDEIHHVMKTIETPYVIKLRQNLYQYVQFRVRDFKKGGISHVIESIVKV